MKPRGISRSSLTITNIWNARGRRPTLRKSCKVYIPRDLRDLDTLRLPASYEEEHFLIQKLKAVTRNKHHHWMLVAGIACYIYFGAIMFQYLEAHYGAISTFNMSYPRESFLHQVFNVSRRMADGGNIQEDLMRHLRNALLIYEAKIMDAASQGYSGDRGKGQRPQWSIEEAIFFCFTVITTVGYGNISPSTNAGRAVTIVYAFLGIPLMLMVLADLGKLFTKAIKFVFRYFRRFYKTGTFNKRKAAAKLYGDKPLQYMTVSWRTVSQDRPPGHMSNKGEGGQDNSLNRVTSLTLHNDELYKDLDSANDEANHKHVEVEDEFNLPVSLAVVMVLIYMVVGAFLFAVWEEWSFFESFYFVFISMSTVGFGDYFPKRQEYMMAAFAYLVLGLTITSMCINVIQEKLSAIFQKAKVRIGNTIGLDVNTLLREDQHTGKHHRSDSCEFRKSLRAGSKQQALQKENMSGIPSRPETPLSSSDLAGGGMAPKVTDNPAFGSVGREVLLNIPLQNRFKLYDSPYSTIHNSDTIHNPSVGEIT